MTKTISSFSLQQIIEEKSTQYILGTSLKSDSVNFVIANNIRQLPKTNISFSKAEVYYVDIDMDAKGYLYRTDDKEFFVAYNKNRKQISELVLKEGSAEITSHDVLKAIILLIVQEELTDVNAKDILKAILSMDKIKSKSPEEESLILLSSKIENIITSNTLSINKVTDDEYEYDEDTDVQAVLEHVLRPVEAETEKEVEKVETTVEAESDKEAGTFEQPSLFENLEDEALKVEAPKKSTTVRKSRKASNKKKDVDVEKPKEKVKVTVEEALTKRPKIKDDAWALAKLKRFGLNDKFIRICMEFRRLQREGGTNYPALTPEQMLMIPDNGKYTGWTEPIKQGIAGILTGKNLIVRGETSTGKTTLIKTICAILNYPMTFAGASMETSIEDLIGIQTLENGNVGVKNAPLITAMIEGAVFYFDEGNAALPSVLIRIHSAIDDERMIFNQLTGEEIHAHPNFRFSTCVNDGYEGTNEMNDATIDRLVAIETKYMKQEDLEDYLKNFPGMYSSFQKNILKMGEISDDDLLILIEIAKALQLGTKNGLPEKMGSLRNINALYDLIKMLDFDEAIKMIVRKYPREERPKLAGVLAQVEALNMTAQDILAI